MGPVLNLNGEGFYLLCFFAIGSKFVDISFAGVFDIFWTFLTHFS